MAVCEVVDVVCVVLCCVLLCCVLLCVVFCGVVVSYVMLCCVVLCGDGNAVRVMVRAHTHKWMHTYTHSTNQNTGSLLHFAFGARNCITHKNTFTHT